MTVRIALAGNPNSGKTTLFNALTGARQYVGNWPGVTVEKKDGTLEGHPNVIIQDLPGIYSLSPYSLEEKVSRRFLIEDCPHAILNIVDGTNIERNLYLSTQLAELGLPMVMAVNMMDVVRRNGDKIDLLKIAGALNCVVVGISAQRGEGGAAAAEQAVGLAQRELPHRDAHIFSGAVEHALAHIEDAIRGMVMPRAIRWYAVKVFERDKEVIASLRLTPEALARIENHIRDCERDLDDDAESIITSQRYDYIHGLVKRAVTRKAAATGKLSLSDRIDRFVTNRILALPLFLLTLSAMWYLAVAENGPGARLTDWANHGLLGEGWRVGGVWVPGVTALLERGLHAVGANAAVTSLVKDGAWGGVATVLGFVPIITIVFLFLSFLEDCGYMSRVAFIMDRVFRKFGLSGKSIIPMLVAKGCGVPAVMSARTIENKRDQRLTILLATFVPCGAKTVVIAMFSSIFFRDMWYVAALMDVIAGAIVVLGGVALKKTHAFAGDAAPFVMELPAYHLPTAKAIFMHTWERVGGYVLKAGLVIFPACVLLWCVMHFDWAFNLLADDQIERSILHDVCVQIAWLFKPLGFGTWQGAAASVSAEFAKEQATATLGIVSAGLEGETTAAHVANLFASFGSYPRLAAFSFMVFNLFIPPCIVAVVTTFREMGEAKWGWFAVGFQTFVGYTIALTSYQVGRVLAGGAFDLGTAAALAAVLACIWFVFRPARKEAAR